MTLKGGMTAPVPLSTAWKSPRRYPHALVLITDVQATSGGVAQEDDWGQPVMATAGEIKFRGFLADVSAGSGRSSVNKVNQANQAGAIVGSYSLKAPFALPVTKNARIRWDAAGDPRRYEVRGIRAVGGRRHNLLIDLQLVDA